jgi:hypothetical protein
MRSRPLLACLAGAFLLGVGSADAGTLTSASWTQLVTPAAGLSFAISRTGAQLGAAGTSTATSIDLALSFPPFVSSFFLPKTANGILDLHVRLTQGGPQAISATAGMGNGTPGIPGSVIVMTAAHILKGVNQSGFQVGINTLVKVPLNVGKLGQFTGTMTVVGALGYLTMDFYAWTPGTLTFTGLTTKGAALPDVVAMGSFNLNSKGGGTVTLVSPSKLSADCSLLQTRSVVSLTTLTLSFVPEPGALLLLMASAVAVLSFDVRRRR